MELSRIPCGTTDWARAERTEHKGESGLAYWQTRSFGGIRVRMVEYTPGYVADHWWIKGRVLLCVEGELHSMFARPWEEFRRVLAGAVHARATRYQCRRNH